MFRFYYLQKVIQVLFKEQCKCLKIIQLRFVPKLLTFVPILFILF